jgi:hypothetical protein
MESILVIILVVVIMNSFYFGTKHYKREERYRDLYINEVNSHDKLIGNFCRLSNKFDTLYYDYLELKKKEEE